MKTPIRITDKSDPLYGKYIHTVTDDKGEVVGAYSSNSKTPIKKDKVMLKARNKFQKILTR